MQESVHRKVTKLVKGPEKKSYEELVNGPEKRSHEEQLREMVVFSLEKRLLRRDLIVLQNYLKRGCNQVGVCLFSQVAGDKRGNCLKLHQGRVEVRH